MRRRGTALLLGLLSGLLLGGCTSLPVSGPVHRVSADQTGNVPEAAYFNPPGPPRDGSPGAIVSGFLLAMQANPLSTSVARSFLSEHAKAAWRPSGGTIVYEAYTVEPTANGARVRLTDTRRLDSRGGWLGARAGSETLDLHLVSEKGQWRIDNPVDALVVPGSYFERSFARFNLYFYDQTDQVLLPDPVFIPRGEQTATNLVRGLLAGPGAAMSSITRSAVPAGTTLDLSVVVTESGIAEVPLSRHLLPARTAEIARLADQLAWTLRQVPGVERVRLSVGGTPLPLPGGRIDVPVDTAPELDAAGSGDPPTLWGIRSGRVVDLRSSSGFPVPGRLGRPGFALRSLAVSDLPRRIAAVSRDGTKVYVAPADVRTPAEEVDRALSSGTDVLRPSYDMFDDLWLLDRTGRGARVHLVHHGVAREVRVPGVTGADVSAFSVARDGSRMAVAVAGRPAPVVRVVDVLRTDEGEVTGAAGGSTVDAHVPDGARVVDLGWRDPGTLAVLSQDGSETSQVTYASADGSPASPALVQPTAFRGPASSFAVAPDPQVPLRLVATDGRMYTLTSSGQWPHTASKVVAAGYGP